MNKRMVTTLISTPRPKAGRTNTLLEREREMLTMFHQDIQTMIDTGWIPLGPMVPLNTVIVQQFYAMVDQDAIDEIDEEE